jgi:hypothetical protein
MKYGIKGLWLVVTTILFSSATLAAPCPAFTVLGQLISAGDCTIGDLTLSQFSFTRVQGASGIDIGNIAVISSDGGAPQLSFSSTPLVFALPGTVVERAIGFTVTAPGKNIIGLTVETGNGTTANASRTPVRTYVCLGAPALVAPDGAVSCSGDLVNIDSGFSQSGTRSFSPVSAIGVVHDIYVEGFASSPGELVSVRDRIETRPATVAAASIPTLSDYTLALLVLSIGSIGGLVARYRV